MRKYQGIIDEALILPRPATLFDFVGIQVDATLLKPQKKDITVVSFNFAVTKFRAIAEKGMFCGDVNSRKFNFVKKYNQKEKDFN